jgi:hypothetical protein
MELSFVQEDRMEGRLGRASGQEPIEAVEVQKYFFFELALVCDLYPVIEFGIGVSHYEVVLYCSDVLDVLGFLLNKFLYYFWFVGSVVVRETEVVPEEEVEEGVAIVGGGFCLFKELVEIL